MKILICVFVTALCGAAAAAEYADGKIGKALILDGRSHTVKVPHYADLKPERVGKGGWAWQEIFRKDNERHERDSRNFDDRPHPLGAADATDLNDEKNKLRNDAEIT